MKAGGDERLLYAGIGIAVATALATIWATGALAALIFGSGPATIPPGGTLGVALDLPSHLGEPRAAWPPPSRSHLPGPVGVYLTLLLVVAAVVGVAAVALRLARRFELPSPMRGRERPPAARWASGRDLAPLRVPSPQPRRLTLGRRGRHLLAAEEGQSVIVFGPTSTHKTSGLVIPAILEWDGPLICTSVKNDLIAPTLERREALGEVWIFDPTQQTGYVRSRATPLADVQDWSGALRVARRIASSAKSGARDLGDADFWFKNAEKLIAPLLMAAVRSDRPIAQVLVWLDEGPDACETAVTPILEQAQEADALRAFLATQNREERQRSSVYTTAETILAALADPRVAEETGGSDYTPSRLLDGANTLYLIASSTEQDRLQAVFSTLILELFATVEARSSALEGPISPSLLMAFDECANVAPVPELDKMASTARGLGAQLLTAFHDLSQAEAAFGKRAPVILNNHHAKLVGRGIADKATTDYFSDLVGAGEFEQRSVSTQKGDHAHRSQTEGDTYRELAPAHVVRQSGEASALLVHGSLPPTMITLRPWYRSAMDTQATDLGPEPSAR